jgi:hypothetical protein
LILLQVIWSCIPAHFQLFLQLPLLLLFAHASFMK